MPWRRRILSSLALLALTGPSVTSEREEHELRSILSKHWEAVGGMRNWSKIESIQLNSTVEREGKIVDICIVKKEPNQIRATVTLPIPGDEENELQIIRAHNGETAWTATRVAGAETMTQEELSPEAARQLLIDAGVLPPLIKVWREGTELELAQSATVDEQSCFVIQTVDTGPSRTTFYVNSESFDLVGYEFHDASGKTNRTTIRDYKSVSGIRLPKTTIIESPDTGRSTVTLVSAKVGVGIFREYFTTTVPQETAQNNAKAAP